jgi:uncharacterized protein (DUF983 family)
MGCGSGKYKRPERCIYYNAKCAKCNPGGESNMRENDNRVSVGVSFGGLLTIAFIVLKLTKVIDWPWVWVLSPVWIPIALLGAILLVVGIYMLLDGAIWAVFGKKKRS